MAIEYSSELPAQEELYDVVIIGGGPAGLSAAIYAARAKLNTVVLDKNPSAGSLGLTDKVENYPGVPQVMAGKELLSIFRNQAQAFGAKIVQSQVLMVDFNNEIKEVMTADGTYRGKTVVVATGAMGRKPTIKGEAEFMGKGLGYCAACDAAFFEDKDVAMIGKIEEVLEELDLIAKFAHKVYVVTHSKELISEQTEVLRSISNVELMLGHRVVEIIGSTTVKGVIIADTANNEQTLDVSGVFVYLHGNQPIVDFLYDAVETTETGCIKVNKEDMSTSVEGVYAVGDVTCKQIRQVVLAAAEGCTAALSADKYINRRQRFRPQWS